jgi:hypothetical protein
MGIRGATLDNGDERSRIYAEGFKFGDHAGSTREHGPRKRHAATLLNSAIERGMEFYWEPKEGEQGKLYWRWFPKQTSWNGILFDWLLEYERELVELLREWGAKIR